MNRAGWEENVGEFFDNFRALIDFGSSHGKAHGSQ